MTRDSLRLLAELGVAIVVAVLPLPVPALLILIMLATLSLGLRGASWLDCAAGDTEPRMHLGIGIVLGASLAVGLQFLLGPGSVSVLLLQGNLRALIAGLFVALATSVGSEMVFRGYVISSMHKAWGHWGARAGLLAGALLSVLAIHPSSMAAAAGAFALSIGYGLLYQAGRQSLVLPSALHFCLLAQPLIYEFANW